MKQWKEEHCTLEPAELEVIGKDLLIQRKNIEEVTHEATEDAEGYTEFVCESREITVAEYEMLKSVEEIDTTKAVNTAIDEYTLSLMEGGVL